MCEVCSLVFETKEYLRKHVKNVHQTARFMCSFCVKAQLQEHEASAYHKGETRTEDCEVCGFVVKGQMKLDLKSNKTGCKQSQMSVVEKLGEILKIGNTEVKMFQYVGFQFDQKEKGFPVNQDDFAKEVIFLDRKHDCIKQVEDDFNFKKKVEEGSMCEKKKTKQKKV